MYRYASIGKTAAGPIVGGSVGKPGTDHFFPCGLIILHWAYLTTLNDTSLYLQPATSAMSVTCHGHGVQFGTSMQIISFVLPECILLVNVKGGLRAWA